VLVGNGQYLVILAAKQQLPVSIVERRKNKKKQKKEHSSWYIDFYSYFCALKV